MTYDPTATIRLLQEILRDTPKLDGAPCIGRPHLFDPPDRGEDADLTEYRHRAALRLCQQCRVRAACRAHLAREPRRAAQYARQAVVGGRAPDLPTPRGRPRRRHSGGKGG